MAKEIKEIKKPTIQLLNKVEYILAGELNNEEYDEFYNYFNEIRKPNILVDIKDVEAVRKCIENLQQRIDKAVEYIETIKNNTPKSTRKDDAKMILLNYELLLNILKGDDTND